MEGAISTPASATPNSGGMSAGAMFAVGAVVVAVGAAAYYFFVYEKDNLTAEAKFNREIQFVKGEPKTA